MPIVLFAAMGVTAFISLLALVLGVIAISAANDARAVASRAANEPSGLQADPPAVPTEPAPLPSDSPLPTGVGESPNDIPSLEPGELEPSANFQLHYGDQKLRVQASCDGREVDLDEPRVSPEKGPDLKYAGCDPYQSPKVTFTEGLRVSVIPSTKASASECAEAIRSSAGDNAMAPAANLTVCLLTSKSEATDQGISQKIVLFRIDSIAKDNLLNVSVTAWHVPA